MYFYLQALKATVLYWLKEQEVVHDECKLWDRSRNPRNWTLYCSATKPQAPGCHVPFHKILMSSIEPRLKPPCFMFFSL